VLPVLTGEEGVLPELGTRVSGGEEGRNSKVLVEGRTGVLGAVNELDGGLRGFPPSRGEVGVVKTRGTVWEGSGRGVFGVLTTGGSLGEKTLVFGVRDVGVDGLGDWKVFGLGAKKLGFRVSVRGFGVF
jgi:hypothetical protein